MKDLEKKIKMKTKIKIEIKIDLIWSLNNRDTPIVVIRMSIYPHYGIIRVRRRKKLKRLLLSPQRSTKLGHHLQSHYQNWDKYKLYHQSLFLFTIV